MKRHYVNLTELIKDNINTPEVTKFEILMKKMEDFNHKGFFSKEKFYSMAMWKSTRPKKHYLSNSEEIIFKISRLVFNSKSDDEKITLLTSLNGVAIPVASSLLTIIDPKNYGVIDIRVWQLLYLYNEVKTKPKGQGFNIKDYLLYLSILRKYAKEFNVNVRDIERVLFFHHKSIQEGNLTK